MRIRGRLALIASAWFITTAMSCSGPTGPTSEMTVDRLVQALQERGLSVKVEGSISPTVNRFFSVPAQQVVIDGSRVSAFEYPSVKAATAEAATVSPDGQPNPVARFSWVGTPHFYRQDRVIVLYVVCASDLIRTLEDVMASPFVVGPTLCRD